MTSISKFFAVATFCSMASVIADAQSLNPKVLDQQREWGTRTLSVSMQRALVRHRAGGHSDATNRGVVQQAPLVANLQVSGVDEALLAQLRNIGAAVHFSSAKYRTINVTVASETQLLEIARLPEVIRVWDNEPRVSRAGSASSRAPEALRVGALGTAGGSGNGIMLGILSDSFARSAAVRDGDTTPAAGVAGSLQGSRPQDSGDLPGVINLLQEGESDGSDEGAAMAELAFDVAPGLGIAFHSAGNSRAAFATAIDTLCDGNNASVLVDDIGFLFEPHYQDGLITQAAAACVARGIPYLSAVGNDGDRGYRQIYVDINPPVDDTPAAKPFVPTGVDLHDWGGGDGFLEIEVPAGGELFVVLQWNQPHASVNSQNGAQIDLDLYVTRRAMISALDPSDPQHVDRSINAQGDTGAPLGDAAEFVKLSADPSTATTFFIAIDHYIGSQAAIPQNEATALEFRLLLLGNVSQSEYAFNGPTVWGHPLAEGVISVAAVPWWEAPDFAPERFGTSAIDPQPYTSRAGRIDLQFDSAGNFAPVSRFAPALASVDGNNTTFFGSDFSADSNPGFGEPDGMPNFFGTSAAAPNAAAVVALIRNAFPNLSPRAIVDGLIATAVDVTGARAQSGTDDVSGAGLIDADAALAFFEANPAPPPPPPAAETAAPASGGGGGGGGCFIATAAYGSYWSEEVRVLREFRDRTLRRSAAGRWVIARYYEVSPPIAEAIRGSDAARTLVRGALTPVVWIIQSPGVACLLLFSLVVCTLTIGTQSGARREAVCDTDAP